MWTIQNVQSTNLQGKSWLFLSQPLKLSMFTPLARQSSDIQVLEPFAQTNVTPLQVGPNCPTWRQIPCMKPQVTTHYFRSQERLGRLVINAVDIAMPPNMQTKRSCFNGLSSSDDLNDWLQQSYRSLCFMLHDGICTGYVLWMSSRLLASSIWA